MSRPPSPNRQSKAKPSSASDPSLPPHSTEAEQGLLACCLLSPALIGKECQHVRADVFYEERHKVLWRTLKDMDAKRKLIDPITLHQRLKDSKQLEDAGGLAYLSELPDKAPSAGNLEYYLSIVREKYALRMAIKVCTEAASRAAAWEGDVVDFMAGVESDLDTLTSMRSDPKPKLEIWTADEIRKWKVPEHLRLVGDNEVSMGYEGVCLIAGPGSSGKSLAVATLALAGARGNGTWMGRTVHRKFKMLILQGENGSSRIKKQLAKMEQCHPELKGAINECIFFSKPPEGGLAFHDADFRREVRELILKLQVDLVVIDTWAQVAAEDASKEVIDKLVEIRSCFPRGESCPGLIIVAHTKKPRPEDVRVGRSLIYSVAGSVALPNTARCCYLLLPWTDDTEDDRIYWACVKLNDGEMYGASVWHRRFGTFFEPDQKTNPKDWGREKKDKEEHREITLKRLVEVFGTETILARNVIVRRFEEKFQTKSQTVYAALPGGARGYLDEYLEKTKEGWFQLKEQA